MPELSKSPEQGSDKLPVLQGDSSADELDMPSQRPIRANPPRKRSVPVERPVESSPRGCWGTFALFFGASMLVVTIVFAITVLAFTNEVSDFMDAPVDNVLELIGIDRGRSTPEVTDTRIIVLGIKQLSVLETVRGDILVQKTVVQEKSSVLKDARLRVQFYGRLTAGVDLSQIADDDIIVQSPDAIEVHLPPAQITGCYLQDPEILESSCGTNFLGMGNCSDTFQRLQKTAYDRGLVDLLQAADELNLLDEAIANAETSIASLLREFGFESITFIRSDETLPPDATCLPS